MLSAVLKTTTKKQLIQNVHINVGSNITVPDAYTCIHTHTHACIHIHAHIYTHCTNIWVKDNVA